MDQLRGNGGGDLLLGGGGRDTLNGGGSKDRYNGNGGKDLIRARDNRRDKNPIRCGSGQDKAKLDSIDPNTKGCEQVIRA